MACSIPFPAGKVPPGVAVSITFGSKPASWLEIS